MRIHCISRFCILLLLMLSAPDSTVGAQHTTDTLDWRGYYPLEVGNAWEYNEISYYHEVARFEIVRDTVIDGTRYFVERQWRFRDRDFKLFEYGLAYIRYDPDRRTIVQRDGPSREIVKRLFANRDHVVFPCDLGAPYSESGSQDPYTMVCGDTELEVYGHAFPWDVPVFDPDQASWKQFVGHNGNHKFGHGVGLTRFHLYTGVYEALYVRVGDDEAGSRVVPDSVLQTPVGTEDERNPVRHSLEIYPNPSVGQINLSFTVGSPQKVSIELFNAVGQRIHSHEMWASTVGNQTLRLSAGSLPAGVYFVRVRTGEGVSETRSTIVMR